MIIFHKVARDLQGGNQGEEEGTTFQMIIYNHVPVRPVEIFQRGKKRNVRSINADFEQITRAISDERNSKMAGFAFDSCN